MATTTSTPPYGSMGRAAKFRRSACPRRRRSRMAAYRLRPTTCSRSNAMARRGVASRSCGDLATVMKFASCGERYFVARVERSETRESTRAIPGFRYAPPGLRHSHIPQRREQREAEQRESTEDEAERKHPKTAAPRFLDRRRLGNRGCDHRVLALDHAAGDVIGDGLDDGG